MSSVVSMWDIEKSFDGTPVLRGVDLELAPGEVHVLIGGNGAGKSTLMKILQGAYQADAGTIAVNGRLGMVFQEFSLVPTLSVARNVFLNHEPRRYGLIDDRSLVRATREIFARMEVELDVTARVATLATGQWQLTEIAKALSRQAEVLILDEPTASLTTVEAEALFSLIGRLKKLGVSIVYISHRMDELYRVGDRITALRDGKVVLTGALNTFEPEQLVEAIVGKQLDTALSWRERAPVPDDSVVLEARNLHRGRAVRDISFQLRRGEILGLAGLLGSGRTELARLLFGVDKPESGEILLRGKPVSWSSPAAAIQRGIVLVPEDRRLQGLVQDHSVRTNLLLPMLGALERGGLVDDRRGKGIVEDLIARLDIRPPSPARPIRLLSGGNQQKVVIAKWLGTEPDVLILDEPTAGVDIGTKLELVELIRGQADAGKGVIVISSELSELLAISDRVLVLRHGVITQDLHRTDIPDEKSLQLAIQGA